MYGDCDSSVSSEPERGDNAMPTAAASFINASRVNPASVGGLFGGLVGAFGTCVDGMALCFSLWRWRYVVQVRS